MRSFIFVFGNYIFSNSNKIDLTNVKCSAKVKWNISLCNNNNNLNLWSQSYTSWFSFTHIQLSISFVQLRKQIKYRNMISSIISIFNDLKNKQINVWWMTNISKEKQEHIYFISFMIKKIKWLSYTYKPAMSYTCKTRRDTSIFSYVMYSEKRIGSVVGTDQANRWSQFSHLIWSWINR